MSLVKYSVVSLLFTYLMLLRLCFAENFSFSGYVKTYALAQDSVVIDAFDNNAEALVMSENFQSQSAIRLISSYLSSSIGNFEIHYEMQPLYFSDSDSVAYYTGDLSAALGGTISTASNLYRYKDINNTLTEVGNHGVVLQNLDRFNYQYSNKYGDLILGRQVVSFGSSRFINPTDIFIPFAIQTLNQEYRVGIDAIRYKADIGDFAVVDLGLVIGMDGKKQNSAAFLRGKNSFDGNDIEAIAIVLEEAWLLGAGLERAFGDFGFWFESAYMNWQQSTVNEKQIHHDSVAVATNYKGYRNNYWRSSIGSDYALNEDIIVMLEYHYNGAGSNDTKSYTNLATQAPYQKAGVYLYGKHYLIPAITWMASPLLSVNASAFYNVSDSSVLLSISSETSWSDNLYSDFGVYLSHGDSMSYRYRADDIDYHFGSEFGAYPSNIYASLRYYF
ncbi:hypothetical protein AADZ84_10560 [Colwelliaceae bacterium MEBiC 14330]